MKLFFRLSLTSIFLSGTCIMALKAQTTGTVTDTRDNKTYKTVTVDGKEWMAENLAYKPVFGNYWAYKDQAVNIVLYGLLYDWATAQTVCPEGWHLPTDAEWTDLTEYLGGEEIAGGKLKETGELHWHSPNNGSTNETGFTALPGGYFSSISFNHRSYNGYWWSATENKSGTAWYRYINHRDPAVYRADINKAFGYSIRCVKD